MANWISAIKIYPMMKSIWWTFFCRHVVLEFVVVDGMRGIRRKRAHLNWKEDGLLCPYAVQILGIMSMSTVH